MQNLYHFIPDAHNEFSLDYIFEDMSVDEAKKKTTGINRWNCMQYCLKSTNRSRDSSGDTSM
jgi:hypothetical protein